MRTKCPICGRASNVGIQWNFVLPNLWKLEGTGWLIHCTGCGFIWNVNSNTQQDWDQFYASKYGEGLKTDFHLQRQINLAQFVSSYFPDKNLSIADFGGGEGFLVEKLKEYGFGNSRVWEVGQDPKGRFDIIIASHVLEHIVDLDGCMRTLIDSLSPAGYILIEQPDAEMYANQSEPPMLDYFFVHQNHFGSRHLDMLFGRWECEREFHETVYYREPGVKGKQFGIRSIYRRGIGDDVWNKTIRTLNRNMAYLVDQLRRIKEPVIVWGASALIQHLLTEVSFPIVYFVDRDAKMYPPGSRMGGIPVYNKVISDQPILVCVMRRKDDILKDIKESGLKNEVIVVELP